MIAMASLGYISITSSAYHCDVNDCMQVLLQKTRKSLLEFMLSGLQKRVEMYNQAVSKVHYKYRQEDLQHRHTTYSSAHAAGAKSSALFSKQLAYGMIKNI